MDIVALWSALPDGVKNALEEQAVKQTCRVVGDLFHSIRESHTHKALAANDPNRAETEAERMAQVIDSFNSTLGDRLPSIDWRQCEEEASDPAFAQFVEDATTIGADTTVESKRLLLGRLIADRLQVRNDSSDERLLRRSLTAVRDLSQDQLRLVAAITLTSSVPIDDPFLTFASRDEAEAYLKRRFFAVARRLKNVYWTSDDFDDLYSLGVARPSAQSNARDTERGADSIDTWLHQHGVTPLDGIEGDLGSDDSRAAYRRRFPTITIFHQLVLGERRGKSMDRPRLDDAALLPVGSKLGIAILEQLLGGRIERKFVFMFDPNANRG